MKYDNFLNKTAIEVSSFSTCSRVKVGAVASIEGRIIATGYNGVPKGLRHCENVFNKDMKNKDNYSTDHHLFSTNNEIHAEQNLIAFCAKRGLSLKGAELYITHSPCIHCAKLIIAVGITRVVYNELYDRDQNFKVLFDAVGIEYCEIEKEKTESESK